MVAALHCRLLAAPHLLPAAGSEALQICRFLLCGDHLAKLHGPAGRLRLAPLKLASQPALKTVGGKAWVLPSPPHTAMGACHEAVSLAHAQLSSVAASLARQSNTASFTAQQRADFAVPTYGECVPRARRGWPARSTAGHMRAPLFASGSIAPALCTLASCRRAAGAHAGADRGGSVSGAGLRPGSGATPR